MVSVMAGKKKTISDGLVQATVPKALAKKVQKLARKEGISISAWIRKLIIHSVEA
jgi:predicted HicB family RNase H-like nuclease